MTPEDSKKRLKVISKATILLGVFTLASRLMGLLRESIFAAKFGAGELLDAYNAAFRVPDFLFNFFILGTLTVAFLPIFNDELVKDEEEAGSFGSTIYTISVACISFLALMAFIFAPTLISIVAPGFESSQRELTILFTRIMMLSPILFTASNISAVILQSFDKFLPTAIAPILYNTGIIFGAVALYEWMGVVGLAVGVVLGAFMYFLINLIPVLKLPIKLRPSFNLKTPLIKKLWKMYLPRIFALDTSFVSLLIASVIGSLLASGSITIFTWANNLQAVPLGIFALSFAVAAFPSLSQSWATERFEDFKNIIRSTSIQILFFIIPLSAFIFLLRAQIVRLVLGRGEFGWTETILTAQTLGVLAISLFAQSLIPLLARAFYATHNTLIPVIVSIVTAIANIILAFYLSQIYGVVGLGLATSIAAVISFVFLTTLLRYRIGRLEGLLILERVLKILIATGIAGTGLFAALYATAPILNTRTTLGIFLQATIASIVGVSLYIIVGLLLNLPEAKVFIKRLRSWLVKLTKPVELFIYYGDH